MSAKHPEIMYILFSQTVQVIRCYALLKLFESLRLGCHSLKLQRVCVHPSVVRSFKQTNHRLINPNRDQFEMDSKMVDAASDVFSEENVEQLCLKLMSETGFSKTKLIVNFVKEAYESHKKVLQQNSELKTTIQMQKMNLIAKNDTSVLKKVVKSLASNLTKLLIYLLEKLGPLPIENPAVQQSDEERLRALFNCPGLN